MHAIQQYMGTRSDQTCMLLALQKPIRQAWLLRLISRAAQVASIAGHDRLGPLESSLFLQTEMTPIGGYTQGTKGL